MSHKKLLAWTTTNLLIKTVPLLTFGSRRVVAPLREMLLRLGSTRQRSNWKMAVTFSQVDKQKDYRLLSTKCRRKVQPSPNPHLKFTYSSGLLS
jgi:hypothetical protein